MTRRLILGSFLGVMGILVSAATAALAAPPASAPTSQAATSQPVAAQPAGSQPAAERGVHTVLHALEQRGESVKDLKAKIEWQVLDQVINDKQVKFGELLFKRDKPRDKFLVKFTRTVVEDQVIDKPEEHLFDGQWYTEKREATKSVIKRQIVRPGEEFDPFKLGQGPFPLPFGQKEAEILAKFQVTCVEPAKDDPANAAHLKLIPKPTAEDMAEKYKELHFFIDKKLDLPVKVVADQKDEKLVTVTFTDIRVNTAIPGSAFTVSVPDDPTWSVSVESLTPENLEGPEPDQD
jgi:hypothetical protein